MKKRLLSVFMTALLILTVFPVSLASASDLGDISGDSQVTAADARLALRASVGLETLTPAQIAAADVNFDGSITAADARFILRASVGLETLHSHSYTEAITKNATCTEKGEKTFTCECGDSYTEDIAASGHKAVTDKAVAATCTKTGKTEGSHCSVCNTVLKAQSTVPAKGHTPKLDESTVKKVTCTDDGYTGDYKCSVCGTLTKKGSTVKATGNDHIMERVTIAASCTQDGYSALQCKICEIYDESTYQAGEKATGHKYGTPSTVKPTCTEQGYTVKVCSVCKADQRSDYTEAKGHSYSWKTNSRPSCKVTGSRTGTCSVCKESITEVLPLTSCNLQATNLVTEKVPGNKTEGISCKQLVKCKTCGKTVSENTSAAAHTVNAENILTITEQSCTTAKIVKHTCAYCDYERDNVIAADPLGHEATLDRNLSRDASCTVDGVYVYSGTCSREGCGENLSNAEVIIPAKGHNAVGTQTCTTAVTCTVCHEDIEPKLGHDYELHAAAYNTDIDTFFCERCGEVSQDQLEVFNGIVNNIKSSSYYSGYCDEPYMNFIDKTSIETTYSRFDFGIYTTVIRNLYEDEMANNSDEYSSIRRQHLLYALPLAVQSNNDLSLLEDADINGITVEKIPGLKFADALANYKPQYTNEAQKTKFDTIKSTNITTPVIKVTIDVKDEKYSQVKSLSKDELTSLQKIYDFDIRGDADSFEVNEKGELVMTETDGGEGYEISMTMKLSEITSDAKVTYYFDAETYEPIIAVYDTDITMDQSIEMKFRIGLFSLNGELDPVITTNYTRAYIFPEYSVK